MAHLLLPQLPKATRLNVRVIEFGNDLTSILGGPSQRLMRMGSRHAVDVALPPLDLACARTWLAARNKAQAEGMTLRLIMPQLGDGTALAGRTAVSGGGTSLTVNSAAGITPGLYFSFIVGDHAYFHQVTDVVGATLSVAPLLRADPAGQQLKFDEPRLQGFADAVAWDLERLRFVGQTFTITEDR